MFWTLEFWKKSLEDPGAVWVMVGALTTIGIAYVAFRQLRDLARTSKSDFLYRLKKDFFTEEARQLIFLVENDILEFRSDEMPYFAVVGGDGHHVKDRMKELGFHSETVSTYLMDDVLLGPLEDVGLLERMGRISLVEAYEEFDSYVAICAESEAIMHYLTWSAEGAEEDDVYDNFVYLHTRLRAEGPRIRARKRGNRSGT
jgi:hypothetical protein